MEENKMVNVSLQDLVGLYTAGYGEGLAIAVDMINGVESGSKKNVHKLGMIMLGACIGVTAAVAGSFYYKFREQTEEKKEDTYVYGEES